MLSLFPIPSKSLAKGPAVTRYRNNAVHRHCSKPLPDSRQYSSEQSIADEEAIAKGMEETSEEFVKEGRRFTSRIS